jgi:5-methylcytosine-specific restriction endonuclease McrA
MVNGMKDFKNRKTVVLSKEGKKIIFNSLKNQSLSMEEMEKLIIELENEFSMYDKLASSCRNKYHSALERREKLRKEVYKRRMDINEKAIKELNIIKNESIGIINSIFKTKEYNDRERKTTSVQEGKIKELSELSEWEDCEKKAIDQAIYATYDLDGKMVNGGKYWYEMRHSAAIARENISALKKLITKKKRDEKLLELKAGAAKNQKKTRTLASPVKSRISEQFKILSQCPYCCITIDINNAHADHIYPVSKGGLSTPKNMVFICSGCNLKKGSKTLSQFIKENNLPRSVIEKNLDLLNKDY